MYEEWLLWSGFHNDSNQKKRLSSAKSAKCTPTRIDKDNGVGWFSGERGDYLTTLSECQCVDYSMRLLPCKHMYRLALEFGLVDGVFESDKKALDKIVNKRNAIMLSLPDIVKYLEECSVESQQLFHIFLYEHLFHKKENLGMSISNELNELISSELLKVVNDSKAQLYFFSRNALNDFLISCGINGFKKNMSLDTLVNWCIENVAEQIKPALNSKIVSVTLPCELTKNVRKVYTYLRRKFDDEKFLDPQTGELVSSPAGAEWVFEISTTTGNTVHRCCFPQDEVTDLLNKYEANRCLGGKNIGG